MDDLIVEALWVRLQEILAEFAQKLCSADPTLIRSIGRTVNDAFLLRAYLSLRKHEQGDEVAVGVDIRRVDQQLVVESDVCLDDGTVVAAGPSVEVVLVDDDASRAAAIGDWLREFEKFLKENELVVSKATAKLI